MKVWPLSMPFKEVLRNYDEIRSKAYMALVRDLPCCVCNRDGPSDPHHPHGVGYRGVGTKAPDIWCIPLCRQHHDDLHHDRREWEHRYGSQFEFASVTYANLWALGLIGINGG